LKIFPKEELYGLSDQIKRFAVSMPSNIAEWNSRESFRDQYRFFSIARWSCAELETQLIISKELWFLSGNDELFEQVEEVSRMLSGLLKAKHKEIENCP
jgi:four helix bundle protein